jgi:hypothetical protein
MAASAATRAAIGAMIGCAAEPLLGTSQGQPKLLSRRNALKKEEILHVL